MPLRFPWRGIGTGLLALTLAACAPTAQPANEPVDGASTAPSSTEHQAGAGAPRWIPSPGISWQWQLSGVLDLTVDAGIFDVDHETTTDAEIATLKADGRRTICYLSAGSWEDFRADAGDFPDAVRGSVMDGWPDERWLDIRRLEVLLPIIAARMDTCVAKGFDAVEPDNVDGYLNATGFPRRRISWRSTGPSPTWRISAGCPSA